MLVHTHSKRGDAQGNVGKFDQHGCLLFEIDFWDKGEGGGQGDHEQPWQHDFEIGAGLGPFGPEDTSEKPFGDEEEEHEEGQECAACPAAKTGDKRQD